eukprot:52974-Chlamydomonas_euryale.AAC.1
MAPQICPQTPLSNGPHNPPSDAPSGWHMRGRCLTRTPPRCPLGRAAGRLHVSPGAELAHLCVQRPVRAYAGRGAEPRAEEAAGAAGVRAQDAGAGPGGAQPPSDVKHRHFPLVQSFAVCLWYRSIASGHPARDGR